MAQFPSTPAFGAGYPPFPIYPPFASHPPQQMTGNQPGNHQNNALGSNPHTPTPLSNTMRYEANTHVNPPAPFPFPHNFNPELLKHLPPPPPPLANYTPAPGTPNSFSHFQQAMNNGSQHYGQQTFQPFQQLHSQMGNLFSQTQGSQPTIQTPKAIFGQDQESRTNENTLSAVSQTDQNIDISQMPDQSSFSSSTKPTTNHNIQQISEEYHPEQSTNINPVLQNVHEPLPSQSRNPPLASSVQNRVTRKYHGMELREHAKAAVLALNSHNIGYKDILAEGVSAEVLQELFTDLGLDLNTLNIETANQTTSPAVINNKVVDKPVQVTTTTQSGSSTTKPTNVAAANTSAKLSQGHLSVGLPLSTISPGLERKDRIAQLLAAKTGKGVSNSIGSKSASPTSTSEPVAPALTTAEQQPSPATMDDAEASTKKSTKVLPQTELVRQKMVRLRQEAADKLKAQQKQNEVSTQTSSNPVNNITPSDLPTGQLPSQSVGIRPTTNANVFSSMIPGLFMTGDEEVEEIEQASTSLRDPEKSPVPRDQITQRLTTTNSSIGGLLKRPAAIDFQEDNRPDSKRPNLSRSISLENERIMHDLETENASEGEIVEDESQSRQGQSVPATDVVMTESAYEVTTNKSQRGVSAATALPYNGMQTHHQNESTGQNLYHSKQSEIEIIRKRIAEMQQKKGIKRTSSFASSPIDSTPTTPVNNQVAQGSSDSPFIPKPQEAEQSTTKDATMTNARPITKLTSAQIAEKAARLKADFIRQRALRQKQLTEGMPVLNDEVNKTQDRVRQSKARLLEIRAEIQKHDEELSRAHQEEEQILGEIKRLEKQLQDGVIGQKQFSSELKQITLQAADETNTPQEYSQPAAPPIPGVAQIDTGVQQQIINNTPSPELSESTNKKLVDNVHDVQSDIQMTEAVPQRSQPAKLQERVSMINPQEGNPSRKGDLTPEMESSTNQSTAEADYETDDDESMDQSDDESEDPHMSVDEASDGSASMSDSGSDDYEPAEAGSPEHHSDETRNVQPPEYSQPQDPQTPPTDSNDDYEPSENLENIPPVDQQASQQPESISVSTAASNSDQSPFNIPDQQQPTKAIEIISEVIPGSKADDQEQGLQLSEADTLTKTQDSSATDQPLLSGDIVSSSARFVPYQSPLSAFKAYRFHPSFLDQVKNGYRSLTYSNKIDPKNPICPTELAGEACGDVDCEEQHFGSMVLSDDKILVQMSSAIDIKDKALRDQYLMGLKQVIAHLRQNGVKEFSLVAEALSKYRREWAINHFDG